MIGNIVQYGIEKTIKDLRNKHSQAVGAKKTLEKSLQSAEAELKRNEQLVLDCQKARAIVQAVAEETQSKIEFHISNLVSLALKSVFPDPYEFKLKFVLRRNRTEADLLFVKNNNEGNPIDIAGGGALDVASFALRCAVWSIKPNNNVLILDEPFHFLSRNLQNKCSQMIKMISKDLGIQFIIVSHVPEITESADKIFTVTNEEGISKITEEEK